MTTTTDEAINLANDDLYAPDPGENGADQPEPGPDTITDEAPYGYTRDRATGGWRPKLAPGRPRLPRSEAELAAEPPPEPRPPDEPPGAPGPAPAPTDEDVPMPKGGTIAKGVNRLYRRVGRVVRGMDHDIGQAIIECTRAEEEDDITVGEAWENLCRANVRIRKFVLGALKGSAWQDLAMAHAPIIVAIFAKQWIIDHLPIVNMIAGWFQSDDEDQADGDAKDNSGLRVADVRAMADVTEATFGQAARRAGAGATITRLAAKLADGSADATDLEHLDPDLVKAATALAQKGVPPGLRRQQPKNRSRARRRH